MLLSRLKEHQLAISLLFILVFITYIGSLGNGFVSDDIASILQNPLIGNFGSAVSHMGLIRPVLYWLAYQIGGFTPAWYHLINVFFHLGVVYLLYLVIGKLHNFKIALVASSIFAIHPVLVEPVAWISGGSYIQAAFFCLLSFYLYLKRSANLKNYLLAIFFYWWALSSQATPIAFLPIFALYELIIQKKPRNLVYILPFAMLGLILFAITLGDIPARAKGLQTIHYQKVGLSNPLFVVPISLANYFQLTYWPAVLTLYHSEVSPSRVVYMIEVAISLVFLCSLFISYKKNKPIFFWLAFFIINLTPTLIPSIFGLLWIVAERYLYLPLAGMIVATVLFFDNYVKGFRSRKVVLPILTIVLLSLVIRSIIRIREWQNEDTLWIATGRTSPSSPNTWNNLGDVYGRHGDKQAAAKAFMRAIELKPDYADAYHNLGNTYNEMGNKEAALEYYTKAAQISPYLWQSHQNIAALYFESAKYDLAIEHLKMAVNIAPNNASLKVNLGIVFLKTGDKLKAKSAFEAALQDDPKNQNAQYGLTEALK